MTSPRYEDLSIGDRLPPFVTVVSRAQMFLFSAATNNAHRIHYDRSWAIEEEGLRDIVVHGPLHGALMARAVTDWAGPEARMTGYAMRHRRPGFPDEEIRFDGEVVAMRRQDGQNIVDVEIRETNANGEILGTGRISVALLSREATS